MEPEADRAEKAPSAEETPITPLCLAGGDVQMCAYPVRQVLGLHGSEANSPVVMPLVPSEAALLISAFGGSPPGVTGFSPLLLGGRR